MTLQSEARNGGPCALPSLPPSGVAHIWRINHRAQSNQEKKMESMKSKTSLTRKSKAIVGAVATLATITALTMAPISQAFAKDGLAKGGGRSRDAAMGDAVNKARSACGSGFQGYWVSNLEWYNRTWFSADLRYYCSPTVGVMISGSPNWRRA